MDIVSIVIIAALLILIVSVLGWVLKPLWEGPSYAANIPSLPQQTLAELEQRRDAFYNTIKNLELDFETDKIPTAVYQQVRANLIQQAADILRQIDHLAQDKDAYLDGEIDTLLTQFRPNGPDLDKALLKMVRAEIKRTGTANHHSACPHCDHPTETDDAFCSQCGAPLTNRCPACQSVAISGDAFCTRCGARLMVEVAG